MNVPLMWATGLAHVAMVGRRANLIDSEAVMAGCDGFARSNEFVGHPHQKHFFEWIHAMEFPSTTLGCPFQRAAGTRTFVERSSFSRCKSRSVGVRVRAN